MKPLNLDQISRLADRVREKGLYEKLEKHSAHFFKQYEKKLITEKEFVEQVDSLLIKLGG